MQSPDTLAALISLLKDLLLGDAGAEVESKVRELFANLALVPKHEFEAQCDVIAVLENQVLDLEKRLKALESSRS